MTTGSKTRADKTREREAEEEEEVGAGMRKEGSLQRCVVYSSSRRRVFTVGLKEKDQVSFVNPVQSRPSSASSTNTLRESAATACRGTFT